MRDMCSLAVAGPEPLSTADTWRLRPSLTEVHKVQLAAEAWPHLSLKDNLGVTSSLCGVMLVYSRSEHCFEPVIVTVLPLPHVI